MGHRHEGEVLEQWRAWTRDPAAGVRLMTHSGPFVRGIYATTHLTLAEPSSREAIADRFAKAFPARPFVRLLDGPPELTHAVGTNLALIHCAVSDDGREVQVMAAVDNLIKGAGGQAMQSMNLALGLEETLGLRLAGMFPC
jgi:N-acetyl-gamma-glutamylphosphate reductase